jgi:methionyl-tRNA synthetase
MYVWLDALTNYITGVGYPDTGSDSFKKFWPADVHVIGKDIIRFHCVYWPAFLMAANLPIPKKVFAHGFINVEGQKMSKSVGNVIAPKDLLDAFGLDATRYILMREVPHGQDGNFSYSHAVLRVNSDLANGLGNLAQRTLSIIAKNCEGTLPTPGEFTAEDKEILAHAQERLLPAVRAEFENFRFNRGLEIIWKLVYDANGYIDVQAPWALKKTDVKRMETVLYVLSEVIRCLAIIVQPVVPDSAGKMLDQLAVDTASRDYSFIAAGHALKPGTVFPPPQGVFPRIQTEEDTKKATA